MPLLDRLSFSIPRSVHINAPIDDVWQVLMDVQSYPLWCSSIADVIQTRQGSIRRSTNSDENHSTTIDTTTTSPSQRSGVAGGIQEVDAAAPAATAASSPNLIGSTWKITRISVVENSRYSCTANITQCSQQDEEQRPGEGEEETGSSNKKRYILTFSAHEMLGATFLLSFTVESNLDEDSTATNTSPAANTSSDTPQHDNTRQKTGCRVTAIVTMVPYRFFVKLSGIMCCLCLLKYRARMALECDLEELAIYCEERAATATGATAAIGSTAIGSTTTSV